MNEENTKYLQKHLPQDKIPEALEKLSAGMPVQYIVGHVDFYGYNILVDKNVLIPRFETELLVDLTIKKIKQYFPNQEITILDLGTGSGCIAIALNKELNNPIDAVDISKEALVIAKKNAQKNNANINFINTDMVLFNSQKYDVIISNPPYIAYDEEIMDIVKNNEPHIALYADNNGLYFYEKIIQNIPKITKEKYLVCFEIGASQANDIISIANKYLKNVSISVEKDYHNFDRFIFITNIEN